MSGNLAATLALCVGVAVGAGLARIRPEPAVADQTAIPVAQSATFDARCVRERVRVGVNGESLGPSAKNGSELELLGGYYVCNSPQRGELVALRWAGNPRPLAKIVRGLPGDRFELELTGEGERLRINGQVAATSDGQPYVIDERSRRVLETFRRSYDGRIPAGSLLVLGDRPQLTTDSRVFGLVSVGDLLGRLRPVP